MTDWSPSSLQVSFPATNLPKMEKCVWLQSKQCYITNNFLKIQNAIYRNRKGGKHNSTHLSQKENFKPLDISRTVPCVIAHQAYRQLEFINVPAALVINTQ